MNDQQKTEILLALIQYGNHVIHEEIVDAMKAIMTLYEPQGSQAATEEDQCSDAVLNKINEDLTLPLSVREAATAELRKRWGFKD